MQENEYMQMVELAKFRKDFNDEFLKIHMSVSKRQLLLLDHTEIVVSEKKIDQENIDRIQEKLSDLKQSLTDTCAKGNELLEELKRNETEMKILSTLKNSEQFKLLHEL